MFNKESDEDMGDNNANPFGQHTPSDDFVKELKNKDNKQDQKKASGPMKKNLEIEIDENDDYNEQNQ